MVKFDVMMRRTIAAQHVEERTVVAREVMDENGIATNNINLRPHFEEYHRMCE